jgi:protoporphyrinogen oxidase
MPVIDFLVVGGGISGLFFMKKLLRNDPKKRVLLLEAKNRFGGRIRTVKTKLANGKKISIEAGAGRFSKDHKTLVKLIKHYGLYDNIVKNGNQVGYYLDGQHYKDAQSLPFDTGGVYDPTDLIELAFQNAKDAGMDPSEYYKYFSGTILQRFLTRDQYEYLNFVVSYTTELNDVNAETSLQVIADLISRNKTYYSLRGGLVQLIQAIRNDICRNHPTSHMKKNSQVVSFNGSQGNYSVKVITPKGEETYQCKHIVLAISPHSIKNIECPRFQKEISPLLDSVSGSSLCRVYSVYPTHNGKAWFHGLPRIVSDNTLRYTIPINSSNGLIMSSYTDGHDTQRIYELSLQGKLGDFVTDTFRDMFPTINIPDAEHTDIFYWSRGIHHFVPGIKPEKMSKLSIQPTAENVYIIGEAFSRVQSWIESGLSVANQLLEHLENVEAEDNAIVTTPIHSTRKGKIKTKSILESQYPAFRKIINIKPPARNITTNELQQHVNPGKSAWIALFGIVFDITSWIPKHPGGRDAIMKGVGKDYSFGFSRISIHKSKINYIYNELKDRAIGRLID